LAQANLIILGDLFFHGRTIIFDKPNNRIGFISQDKNITIYPHHNSVYLALDLIALLALVVAVFILMLRKRNRNTISELAEGLNRPEVEMTVGE
jgi:sensor c-di-GMP phosphodiesterase-like protein